MVRKIYAMMSYPLIFLSFKSKKQQHLFSFSSISRSECLLVHNTEPKPDRRSCHVAHWELEPRLSAQRRRQSIWMSPACAHSSLGQSHRPSNLPSAHRGPVSALHTCGCLFLHWQCSELRSSVTHTASSGMKAMHELIHSMGRGREHLCILDQVLFMT